MYQNIIEPQKLILEILIITSILIILDNIIIKDHPPIIDFSSFNKNALDDIDTDNITLTTT